MVCLWSDGAFDLPKDIPVSVVTMGSFVWMGIGLTLTARPAVSPLLLIHTFNVHLIVPERSSLFILPALAFLFYFSGDGTVLRGFGNSRPPSSEVAGPSQIHTSRPTSREFLFRSSAEYDDAASAGFR